MSDTFVMGLDIGSTASKCVILKQDGEWAGTGVISSGTGTSGPERAMQEALDMAGLAMESISAVTATGYGRNSMENVTYVVSELTCHTRGVTEQCPDAATIIDIGGQDAKVISVGANGRMQAFLMNDKCAAGTGRFLDVMAGVLELKVAELGEADARASAPVTISSTCTVFAESEVISQLSRKTPIPDLVAGIHKSVAARTAGLVNRLGLREPVVMTGGVAQNTGVVRALEAELKAKIHVVDNAQLMGACGAALYGLDRIKNRG